MEGWAKAVADVTETALKIGRVTLNGEFRGVMAVEGRPETAADVCVPVGGGLPAGWMSPVEIKLTEFKAYVHARLDAADIPADPPGPHRDAGCRIGQRLTVLIDERDRLREMSAELREALQEAESMLTVAMGNDLHFGRKTRDEITSHPGMAKIRAALGKGGA